MSRREFDPTLSCKPEMNPAMHAEQGLARYQLHSPCSSSLLPHPRLDHSQVSATLLSMADFAGPTRPECVGALLMPLPTGPLFLNQTVDASIASAGDSHYPLSWEGRMRIIPSLPASPDDPPVTRQPCGV